MKKAKPLSGSKGLKNAHTSNSKYGMGDNYGSGVKAPVGRMVDGMGMKPVSSSKLKKAPRSLA